MTRSVRSASPGGRTDPVPFATVTGPAPGT